MGAAYQPEAVINVSSEPRSGVPDKGNTWQGADVDSLVPSQHNCESRWSSKRDRMHWPFFSSTNYSTHGVQNLATRPPSPAHGPDLGNLGRFVPTLLSQIDRTPRVWHPSRVTYARGFGSSH